MLGVDASTIRRYLAETHTTTLPPSTTSTIPPEPVTFTDLSDLVPNRCFSAPLSTTSANVVNIGMQPGTIPGTFSRAGCSASTAAFYQRSVNDMLTVTAAAPPPGQHITTIRYFQTGTYGEQRGRYCQTRASGVVSAVGGAIGSGIGLQEFIAFGWSFAAVLLGQALAARSERAAAERERLAHAHEQALATERLRIAQDLHDSVAHAMATINVQSGVAAHLVDRKPEQAAVALEAIRTASRDALDELGAILGVLRDQTSSAPLTPVAGIADIDGLVERARADGLAATLSMSGDLAAVPTSIGTAAYRVVQEGLTNTRRHAGPGATATVEVVAGERHALRVAVLDDGGSATPSRASTGAGFGLIGMRERVETSGGTLEVGPVAGRGHQVIATWQPR